MRQMYEMWTIATGDPVAWCVSLTATRVRCAKTAERIEVLFVAATLEYQRHILFDGGLDPLLALFKIQNKNLKN